MPTQLEEILVDAAEPAKLGAWWAEQLGWCLETDPYGDIVVIPPSGEPGAELLFPPVPDPASGSGRVHLDLRSESPQQQAELIRRAVAGGARRADVGQGDVPWAVLEDPEGNLFCVLEPRPDYARTGALAAVVVQALDPPRMARFWAHATDWGVTTSQPRFASVRAPGGVGPAIEFVAVDRLPAGKNRLHLDVRPVPGSDQDAEVARLVGLGARPLEIGQSGAAPGEVTWR